ncbi:MAG: tRNA dihydrouridine synthase DusB [Thermodesulfobacteriota bacterium]
MIHIGNVKLQQPTVMAPMAGITDVPFRRLVKEAGCGLVCTEMVSANGLVYDSEETFRYLKHTEQERPVSIQIFGKDPAVMADAAAIVAANGADIVDINFGCSVKKILKNGAGAALMQNMADAEKLLQTVRAAISVPLTIKMRTGWESSGEDAVRLAQTAEAAGVDAVSIHPRTARQKFRGTADWSVIAAVKEKVNIAVIGNGDVTSAEDALSMFAQTGCDAVMIGRAAVRNPWIFPQVTAELEGRTFPEISLAQRYDVIIGYIDDAMRAYGELRASRMMRSRLGWLVKGLSHATRFRESITKISSRDEAVALIDDYFAWLKEKEKEEQMTG